MIFAIPCKAGNISRIPKIRLSSRKMVVTQSFVEEECVTSQKNVYLGGYTFYNVAETLSRKKFVR